MDELQQLLKRWSELEPGRCLFCEIDTGRYSLNLEPNYGIYSFGPDMPSNRILSHLEYAIREAVIARSCWFCLSYNGEWMIEVISPKESAPNMGPVLSGDTVPAIALLRAYIEALEGMK